jgi:hypothetical protein
MILTWLDEGDFEVWRIEYHLGGSSDSSSRPQCFIRGLQTYSVVKPSWHTHTTHMGDRPLLHRGVLAHQIVESILERLPTSSIVEGTDVLEWKDSTANQNAS